MKSWKRTLFTILAIVIVLSLALSACGLLDRSGNKNDNGSGKDKDKGNSNDKDKPDNPNKITICHKTGSAKNPYIEISVANDAVNDGHGSHEGDIIPASESGCPTE